MLEEVCSWRYFEVLQPGSISCLVCFLTARLASCSCCHDRLCPPPGAGHQNKPFLPSCLSFQHSSGSTEYSSLTPMRTSATPLAAQSNPWFLLPSLSTFPPMKINDLKTNSKFPSFSLHLHQHNPYLSLTLRFLALLKPTAVCLTLPKLSHMQNPASNRAKYGAWKPSTWEADRLVSTAALAAM